MGGWGAVKREINIINVVMKLCYRCRENEAEENERICNECFVDINFSNLPIRRKLRGEWRGGGFKKIGEILEEKPEK